jgi:hypothetical protein
MRPPEKWTDVFRVKTPSPRALAAGTVIATYTYPPDGPRAIPAEHAALIIDHHFPGHDELLAACTKAESLWQKLILVRESSSELDASEVITVGCLLGAALAAAKEPKT